MAHLDALLSAAALGDARDPRIVANAALEWSSRAAFRFGATIDGEILAAEPDGVKVAADGVEFSYDAAYPEAQAIAETWLAAAARAARRAKWDRERRRIVHDLRGPLAVVSGQCEMLAGNVYGPMSPEQERSIEAIRRQVDRMRDLIETLRNQPAP